MRIVCNLLVLLSFLEWALVDTALRNEGPAAAVLNDDGRIKVRLKTVHNGIYRKKSKETTFVVKTVEGLVRGGLVEKYGFKYRAFSGIPYAEYSKRWQAPKPRTPWSGIINATKEGNNCPQAAPYVDILSGDEECLVINVNAPNTNSTGLPVLVWVHGGPLIFGTGSNIVFGPHRLVKRGVMVVTFNYRIGVHGFLCLRTRQVPGNAGMKDVIEALRWVRRNIKAFGGDPNNISLMGMSSGAAIVDLVAMSPMGKGLFQKLVLMSGSVFTPVGIENDHKENALKLGKILSLNTEDLDEFATNLQKVKNSELTQAVIQIINVKAPSPKSRFGVCIEKRIEGEQAFLEELPKETLRSQKFSDVPILLGHVAREGVGKIAIGLEIDIMARFKRLTHEYFIDSLPDVNVRNELVDSIEKFFFHSERAKNKSTVEIFKEVGGDLVYWYGEYRTAVLRLEKSKKPMYMYQFGYESHYHTGYNKDAEKPGVEHSEDLGFYFQLPMNLYEGAANATTRLVINRMTKIVSNFAKFGNPAPRPTKLLPVKWKPVKSVNVFPYLEVTDKIKMVKGPPFKDRNKFWDQLFMKYNVSKFGYYSESAANNA